MLQLKPILDRSVSEGVYEQLREAIVSGELAAGEVLPGERRLCEMLRVNRGAVREALKRLEQDRLVSTQQGEGTTVLDFLHSARVDLLSRLMVNPSGKVDPKVARSVRELRSIMTPDLVRLAAARRTDDDVVALKNVLAALRATRDQPPTFQERVESFWAILALASQNVAYRLLNNTMRDIHLETSQHLRSMLGPEFWNVKRYQEMADAVVAQDTKRAHEVARLHAQLVTESLDLASRAG